MWVFSIWSEQRERLRVFFDATGYVNTAILLHIRASTDRDFLKKLTKKLTSKLFIFNSL